MGGAYRARTDDLPAILRGAIAKGANAKKIPARGGELWVEHIGLEPMTSPHSCGAL